MSYKNQRLEFVNISAFFGKLLMSNKTIFKFDDFVHAHKWNDIRLNPTVLFCKIIFKFWVIWNLKSGGMMEAQKMEALEPS